MTLDIAKRAMRAQQSALLVVGHNISNVNTLGFSRQKVVLESSTPLPTDFGLIGNGVETGSIMRVYDRYVESQISEETEGLGKWNAKRETLERVEAIFNESSDYGLNNAMNEFWNAWHNLANNPTGQAERTTLISRGGTLVTTLNDQYANIRQVQDDLNSNIRGTLGEINIIADQIAELNNKILAAETSGSQAGDYRDARTSLINELSGKININYYENPGGMLTIMVGEGRLLVDGYSSWDLQGEVNVSNNGFLDVKWDTGNGADLVDITSDISGGELDGWLELRDVTIEDYKSRLNTFAKEIIEEVNSLHSGGVGLDGYGDLTGSFAVDNTANPLNSAGLPFTPQTGSVTIEVMDSTETVVNSYSINVDPTSESLDNLVTNINAALSSGGSELVAEATANGELRIYTNAGFSDHSFVFTSDSGGTLMALGVNTFFTGYDASTIGINPVVENDVNKIAAATSSESPGDNTNALAIAALENSLLMESGTSTLGDYYNSIVSEIGVESQKASSMSGHQELMVKQLENQRSSISGVSLDEEMMNLIKYQNAYMAATRLVSVVDEMLAAMLEMVR